MERFVCASANPDKVAEIASVLAGLVELVPRPAHVPEVVEDADTLVGNARLKAAALCVATGCAAISDDTGLEVDALGGGNEFEKRYGLDLCLNSCTSSTLPEVNPPVPPPKALPKVPVRMSIRSMQWWCS